MHVDSLELPKEARSTLVLGGVTSLNPPQKLAIEAGLLQGKNLVVASPTASGKTLIAELAFLKMILEKKRKVLYIVPLRALASEKLEDFRKYEKLGVRVAVSAGDYDTADDWLGSYDLIVATSEKLDSLLRHSPAWILNVGLVVADEVHLLNDETRGPTLEVVLTRLREYKPQIIGLSATIANAKELASWLNAELVTSDYRPVALYKGVYDGEAVRFPESDRDFKLANEENVELEICDRTVAEGKQALVFASSRRNAESVAEKCGESIGTKLKADERAKLAKLAEDILNVTSRPTKQCERLARCIRKGTAFHHAGLAGPQRSLVERAFKENAIKVIAATPTLAAGLNLPAYRVVIRDVKRFHPMYGSVFIPVLEYHQMAGRAGRPKYDNEGEAVLLARSELEAHDLVKRYIQGKPEEILSKLGVEPILRMHALALIASHVASEEGLWKFLQGTFFAHQYKELEKIRATVERVLSRLEEQGFITRDGGLEATRIGTRVSQLYIDPETAFSMMTTLEKCTSVFDSLLMIANTREMAPGRAKDGEVAALLAEAESRGVSAPEPWDSEYDDFVNAMKCAIVLDAWASEAGEDWLLEEYGTTPGELRARLETADWLLYAAEEMALLTGLKEKMRELRKARVRVKYGIKEELVALVALKGIGRVRARTLHNAGLTSLTKIRDAPLEKLKPLLGEKLAADVHKQLHAKEGLEDGQKSLGPS
ncbi:MAG: DEAD/DEAH box helicase [Candidatus Aenigmatarchaeota archaeon]|nr:MAG: DEAD/DEAH box helicase [Candidatus Aenigmarchaeota archaeon]